VTRKRAPKTPRLVVRALEIATAKGRWESLRHGVEMLRLCGDARLGPSVALLRYQPGARVPPHRHPGFEVIYVLDGAQSDEQGSYPAGTLVVNREGLAHSVWCETGCLILIMWEQPIEFL
jgi:anti-sigma factor ChrR (cupin superfamily)